VISGGLNVPRWGAARSADPGRSAWSWQLDGKRLRKIRGKIYALRIIVVPFSSVPIPPFNGSGVLPPFLGGEPTPRSGASPYRTTPQELVGRFGTSPARLRILDGLFRYRADLDSLGFVAGFQWLDGSFVEDIDRLRAPNDIDVVTFVDRPPALRDAAALQAAVQQNPALFLFDQAKQKYLTDAYFVDLSRPAEEVVEQTRYWFGLFSHRRQDLQWKGMLALPLGTIAADQEAIRLLSVGGNRDSSARA